MNNNFLGFILSMAFLTFVIVIIIFGFISLEVGVGKKEVKGYDHLGNEIKELTCYENYSFKTEGEKIKALLLIVIPISLFGLWFNWRLYFG